MIEHIAELIKTVNILITEIQALKITLIGLAGFWALITIIFRRK